MRKCWNCGKEIDLQDAYCRYCGSGQGKYVPWYYKIWGIVILFFLLGPLSLWFVARSPVINRIVKLVLLVIILGLSIWFGYALYNGVKQVMAMYMDIFNMTANMQLPLQF